MSFVTVKEDANAVKAGAINWLAFDCIPFKFQQGVYVDFFMEQDIHITLVPNTKGNDYLLKIIRRQEMSWIVEYEEYGGYNRLATQAIIKADEILNSKKDN